MAELLLLRRLRSAQLPWSVQPSGRGLWTPRTATNLGLVRMRTLERYTNGVASCSRSLPAAKSQLQNGLRRECTLVGCRLLLGAG